MLNYQVLVLCVTIEMVYRKSHYKLLCIDRSGLFHKSFGPLLTRRPNHNNYTKIR